MKCGKKLREFCSKNHRDILELEEINIERAHRVGNKSNERNTPKTIVATKINKLFS